VEGHQIGVVKLLDSQWAEVDLFISILDRSGASPEIGFFLPLGLDPHSFSVTERSSMDFEDLVTRRLDLDLWHASKRDDDYRSELFMSLLLGSWFINGGLTWPLWLSMAFSGCSGPGEPAPLAAFETESSYVAIYGVEAETDLDALIALGGLDPSVRETLNRLRGQQIAVVTLKPEPREGKGSLEGWFLSDPGLHFHWTTRLAPGPDGPTYRYPLGTGTAWANPIEVTRVYVSAPADAGLAAQYPALGEDLSGYQRDRWDRIRSVLGGDGPAYAIEEGLRDDASPLWRVTYLQSNPSEDIVITYLPEPTEGALQRQQQDAQRRQILRVSWPMNVVVALLLWIVAWRMVMPHLLGVRYPWRSPHLWIEALGWALLYPLSTGLVGILIINTPTFISNVSDPIMYAFMALLALGTISLYIFAHAQARTRTLPWHKSVLAYLAVTVVANVLYVSYGFAFAHLVGAL
jgi:hypothetical protein